MIEAGRARWRRLAAVALPGVEPDVVVITASRDERCRVSHALHQLEAEDSTIEIQRALEIRHLQVHMTNARAGRNASSRSAGAVKPWVLHEEYCPRNAVLTRLHDSLFNECRNAQIQLPLPRA